MSSLGRTSLVCLLLFPAAAMADEFDDFRIPEHKVFSWTGNLSAAASHQDQSASFGQGKSGQVRGDFRTAASWLHDSDPALTIFSLSALASGQRSGTEQEGEFLSDRTRNRIVAEQWAMGLTQRRYPWRAPLGFEMTLSTRGAYDQEWHNQRSARRFPFDTIATRLSTHHEQYDYRVSASGALGLGRVRDATVVYEVRVLEERLRSRGVLHGPLSVATRERLAALFYNRSSYTFVLDRPGRTFWEDLIGVLKRDDSFASEWDPVSAFRVLEPFFGPTTASLSDFLPRSPIARMRGWFVGVTSSVLYSAEVRHDAVGSFQQRTVNGTLQPPLAYDYSYASHEDGAEILVGPRVEWHSPLGPRWQADASTAQSFPTRGAGGMSSLTVSSLSWLVTDRWLASANATHQLELERVSSGAFANELWAFALGASVSWFLENHLQLGMNASAVQFGVRGEYSRDYFTGLSLGYRFAGRIESPGLAEPIRVP